MSTTKSRLVLAALAAGVAALALPGAAFAQDDHHGDHGGDRGGAARPAPAQQGGHPAGPAPQAGGAAQGGWNGGGRPTGGMAAQPNHVIQGAAPAQVTNIPGQMHTDGAPRMGQGNPGGQRPGMPQGGGWNGGGRVDPGAPGYHRFDGQTNPGRPGGNQGNWTGEAQHPGGGNGQDQHEGGWNGQDQHRGGGNGQDQRPGGWNGQGQRPGGGEGGGRQGWNGSPGRAGHYDPRPQGNYRAWSPQFRESWRGDARYNWRDWREGHRDAYRLGRYYAPYGGAYYSRLSVGFVLDPAFYANSYVIYDPWTYRLPPAWAPYHWVRYYDDALLVDTYTGQVVDVLYDFFW